MEDTKFDLLLRRAAQQTSRRATLGALVSGALLLGDLEASEATKKAERRKKRRKQGGLYRGFYITIDNANGNAPASIEGGDRGDFN